MSTGFNVFVVVFTLVNILACFWLLWWNRKSNSSSEAETTGHSWDDGEISEYNKPLPRWWLNLFVFSIIWGLGYLVAFPGLGGYPGMLGWTSIQEHNQTRADIEQRYAHAFEQFRGQPLEQMAQDPQALKLGQSIFANVCAACHGADARGAAGFPSLADNDWLYGGDSETLLKTVMDGRNGVMPPWKAALGPDGVQEVVAYVQSLSGQPHGSHLAEAGKARFAMFCVACHGADGKGNVALGAPNLTDSIWLYGGNAEQLAVSIGEGRNGAMPAHGLLLGADKVRAVVAYVYSLSRNAATGAQPTVTTAAMAQAATP